MAVTLSASLIANINTANPFPNNPRTAEEWIIGAINYLHSGGGGGGDILADGSVPFTGQETFGVGLKTDTIEEKTLNAGVSFPNDIHANTIKDAGSTLNIIPSTTVNIAPTGSSDINITTTASTSSNLILTSDILRLATTTNGNVEVVLHGTGNMVIGATPAGSGTIDTAVTPNLVFQNGFFISAS